MNILVIDGQGGNIGRQLVKCISEQLPDAELRIVGTNSIATANMLKAGTNLQGATGENAVIVACRKADVIVGPVGIVIADALLGEVTPKLANAVAQSNAARILIPFNRCDTIIAGAEKLSISELIDNAVDNIKKLCKH